MNRRLRVGLGSLSASLLPIVATSCGFLPLNRVSTTGTDVLRAAPKPAPVDSEFEGCGADGSQPDYALNRLKDRIDDANYIAVPWSMIANLPWPRRVGYRFRNQWTQGERDDVNRYEGAAIRVDGYLAGYRLEGPEPPNCYSTARRHRDFHLWLTEKAHQTAGDAMVVELTPRVRAKHSAWTEDRLAALVATQVPVRVSGWLLLDQMHPESIRRNRRTLWEVHPIMHLEWQQPDGVWVSLDTLSPIR